MSSKTLRDARSNAANDAYYNEKISRVIMEGSSIEPPPGMNEAEQMAWERAVKRQLKTRAGSPEEADLLAALRSMTSYKEAREEGPVPPMHFADAARRDAERGTPTSTKARNLGLEEEAEAEEHADESRSDKTKRDRMQNRIDRDREIRASEDS